MTVNPWSAVKMPEDAVKPGKHAYTREQSEDLVSALVDHVDAQLVLSLACFLALGPAEIAGLRWEDIDAIGFTFAATLCSVKKAPRRPLNVRHRCPFLTKCACRWSCGVRSVTTRKPGGCSVTSH